MSDRQDKLRTDILALCQDHIGEPAPGTINGDCIEAATACMGAAAFMIGVLRPDLRAVAIQKLLENFPKRVAHLGEEIRRGEFDGAPS